MFYVTSNSTNLWYPTKAKTLNGAKRNATMMFSMDASQVLKVGKSSVCGIQCVSVRYCNSKSKWVDLND